jgi:hypothetical protein
VKDKNQKKEFMKSITQAENELLVKENAISKLEAEVKIVRENLTVLKG